MLVYPQLDSGALSQFPVKKRRRLRTVVNPMADGSAVKLADAGAGTTEWQLAYEGLTDAEAERLGAFFAAVEGTLNGFTFLDPVGNLLAWSGQLENAVWNKGPLLAVSATEGGWRLANAGAGAQSLTQTLAAPGDYTYCLSVYARAGSAVAVTLLRNAARSERHVGTEWTRLIWAGSGQVGAETITFGIELPAGAGVEVCGLQVEAQAGASGYKATTREGVYEGARFRDGRLSITATGVNRHAATVNIIHADHL